MRPRLIVDAIAQIQDAGVAADVWKVEGVADPAGCAAIVAAARRDGRDDTGVVVLGAGAGVETVNRWLEAAAAGGYSGFAVGRSIWADAVVAHDRDELDAAAARARIAARYRGVHRHVPARCLTPTTLAGSDGVWAAIAAGTVRLPTQGGYTMNRTLGALGALALGDDVQPGRSGRGRAGRLHRAASAPEGDITVWAMGTEGDNLGVLADAFMEEFPDVSVEVTAVPWDAAHDRLVTAIAGGDVPDVSMIGTTWMGEFATMGGLEPTPDSIDPAQFFEGAWNTTVVDGMSYGVPWYVETRLVYYRTDLAEEGGFNQAPATWEELTAARPGDGRRWRRVRHQPAARRHRRLADVHAVLLAGRRRDRRRGQQLHARLGGVRRGDDVLRLVLRGAGWPSRPCPTCPSRRSSPTAPSARSSAGRG